MRKLYFTISEFLIDKSLTHVPVHVVDKIIKHIAIINPIREQLGIAIGVSKNSGYRPYEWEIERGRQGTSEHMFGEAPHIDDPALFLGAADYSCSDMQALVEELKKSAYRRICYYPGKGFVHCDFKGNSFLYFEDLGNGWEFKEYREVDHVV